MPALSSFLLATSAVGTAAYAAAGRTSYDRVEQPATDETVISNRVEQEILAPTANAQETDHFFAASSLSLGLSMGGLIFQPLMAASVPINIYTAWPAVRRAFRIWADEKRVGSPTIEAALLLGSIATQHFFSASAISWTYCLGRKIGHQTRADFNTALEKVSNFQGRKVWIELDDTEIESPLSAVEAGDVIIMRQNDIVPLAGRVTKGNGTINTFLSSQNAEPVEVEIGDLVPPYAIVMSGRIHILVMN
ncbi:MAG: hypothetical protein ACPG8W_17525 [Candidatus Promineifilaceae bacterium]